MVIYNHEKERRVLERRLELLDILDDIVRRGIHRGETTDVEGPEVQHIKMEFKEVLNPCDVCDRIKEIYNPEHFGMGSTRKV
jgi:hypothetical protein